MLSAYDWETHMPSKMQSNERAVTASMNPSEFLWGTATSSYQIEGGVDEGGRVPSIWDTFSKTPGKIIDGSNGDVACDHFHRYEEDVNLLVDLGVDAYRFSIAWPRIMADGDVNGEGLNFYGRLLDRLSAEGIAAYATLYHWDLPQSLEDAGGWTNRETAYAFAEYAGEVSKALGDQVASWATLNEPWCSSYLGYADGVHAPGRTDMGSAFAAAHHLNLAHGLGVRAIRRAGGDSVGVVLNLAPVRVVADTAGAQGEAIAVDVWRNRIWLDPIFEGYYSDEVLALADTTGRGIPIASGDLAKIGERLDWLGINYYHDLYVPEPPPGPRTNMGWPITPEGMYDVLAMAAERTGLPLYVTENGGAFASHGSLDDRDRIAYLDSHIREVWRAVDAGINVRGYFLWSLLDNFEWAQGYQQRFGLVHVDYDTLKRSPRKSFDWYRQVIATNRIQ